MKTPVNASSILLPDELECLKDLSDTNDTLKDLESKKQSLVTKIKEIMNAHNVDSLTFNGRTYTISSSQRMTVVKTLKDEFISELINSGKKYLIHTSIEPDLNSIFAEVDAGTVTQDFVDKYVKVTPIITLRCT